MNRPHDASISYEIYLGELLQEMIEAYQGREYQEVWRLADLVKPKDADPVVFLKKI